MLSKQDVYGCRNLIAAILNQSIADALIMRRPRPPQFRTNKKHLDEQICWEAREFIDAKNKLFICYSTLIDIDPDFLSEYVWSYIRKYDDGLVDKPRMKAK